MRRVEAPEFITVEFLSPRGEPEEPLRVRLSRAPDEPGCLMYRYDEGGVELPHGLETFVRVEGTIIPMETTRSADDGRPIRKGATDVMIAGMVYKADASLAGGPGHVDVRVRAFRKPRGSRAADPGS